ncbi:MAG TPA: hypothetical protein VN719_08875 [Gemmatimonadales bacterium]|nr:hypothetical protein [Gemmatimonadales bacterium]
MPEQYAATDKRTGLEVAVTGEFPPASDDRIRIARTTTLFTRLMSTILSTESEMMRRERFHAVETQLELAEALIREDMEEVQRLMRQTLEKMGITPDQLDEMAKQLLDQLRENPDVASELGLDPDFNLDPGSGEPPPPGERGPDEPLPDAGPAEPGPDVPPPSNN